MNAEKMAGAGAARDVSAGAGDVEKVSGSIAGTFGPLNQSSIDPMRDRATGRRMIKMEVEVREGIAGIIVPGASGHRVGAGKHVIEVFEGDEKLFKEVLETNPEWVTEAREMFWTVIAADVLERVGYQLDVSKMVDLIAGRAFNSETGKRQEPDDAMAREIAHSLATTPHSVEERFVTAHGRGMRPMLSAKVISAPFPEPQQVIEDQKGARQIDLVRQVIGAAGVPAGAAAAATVDAEQLLQIIAEQKGRLDAQATMLERMEAKLNSLEEAATAPAAPEPTVKPKR